MNQSMYQVLQAQPLLKQMDMPIVTDMQDTVSLAPLAGKICFVLFAVLPAGGISSVASLTGFQFTATNTDSELDALCFFEGGIILLSNISNCSNLAIVGNSSISFDSGQTTKVIALYIDPITN